MINTQTSAPIRGSSHGGEIQRESAAGRTPGWHYWLAGASAITMLFHVWVLVQATILDKTWQTFFLDSVSFLLWIPAPIGFAIGLILMNRQPRASAMLFAASAVEMFVFMVLAIWLVPAGALFYFVLFVQNAILANVTALTTR